MICQFVAGWLFFALCQGNTFIDWIICTAEALNPSQCGICGQLPASARAERPWAIRTANQSQWKIM